MSVLYGVAAWMPQTEMTQQLCGGLCSRCHICHFVQCIVSFMSHTSQQNAEHSHQQSCSGKLSVGAWVVKLILLAVTGTGVCCIKWWLKIDLKQQWACGSSLVRKYNVCRNEKGRNEEEMHRSSLINVHWQPWLLAKRMAGRWLQQSQKWGNAGGLSINWLYIWRLQLSKLFPPL